MTNTPGDQPDEGGRREQADQPEEPTAPYAPPPFPSGPPAYPPGPPAYPSGPAPYPSHGQVQYAPDHPRATTSLILGILGIVLCQVLAPVALWIGRKTVNEIDASGGRLGGRSAAQAGYVMGIIGTVLLAIGLVFLVIYLVFMVAVIGGVGMSGNA